MGSTSRPYFRPVLTPDQGIAIRMAQIMRLPHNKLSENPAVTETRKRVFWTLFMADRWCSSASGLPRQIQDNDYAVDFPIDESIFQQPGFSLGGSTGSTLGIWAYKIMLAKIFGHIQDFNRSNVVRGLCQRDFDGHVKLLAEQLDDWEMNLPSHMQLTDQNIQEYHSKGLGGTFIDLHLGFHHYATLLFFNYLESRRLYSRDKVHYSQLCKSHAFRFSELLQVSREKKGCEAVHAAIGHMTIVSSAVLVHVLLMGEVGELEAARSGLISNFKTLLELKKFWPSLGNLVRWLLPH
ncbi:NADH dehydrogenase [Fusarium sp. NRRL 25303]|nr:NADH dehydrogenase [Fusarium sp. NRRL 25303]